MFGWLFICFLVVMYHFNVLDMDVELENIFTTALINNRDTRYGPQTMKDSQHNKTCKSCNV